jgi:hypothetical protein
MSKVKKIFKTIEKGLPTTKSGIGMDIDELIGPKLLDKSKGDYANISAVIDTSKKKLKPEAVLAGRKDNIGAFLSSSGKDDISGGIDYLTEDKSTSFGLGASKSGKDKNITIGVNSRFEKGGMTKGQKKVGKVMREFKKGELHSGKKGPVVKNRKQAIAIALSEAGMSKPKQMSTGGDVVVGKGQDYIKDLI